MIILNGGKVQEAEVRDETGKFVTVKIGDSVKLLSAGLRERYGLDLNQRFSSQEVFDFLKKIYGDGHHPILLITKCLWGKYMLHLRSEKPEFGCCSSNFIKV